MEQHVQNNTVGVRHAFQPQVAEIFQRVLHVPGYNAVADLNGERFRPDQTRVPGNMLLIHRFLHISILSYLHKIYLYFNITKTKKT